MNTAQDVVALATLELPFLQRKSEPERSADTLKYGSRVKFIATQRRRITLCGSQEVVRPLKRSSRFSVMSRRHFESHRARHMRTFDQ